MCGGPAGVRCCLACPSSLLDLPCGAACAVLLRAGCSRPWGRVGVPPILGHTGGGVHFPGPCGTRPGRVFGVCVGWLWADLSDVWAEELVQTNAVRYGVARTGSLLVGAAHTRAVMRIITAHLCDCECRCGRMCRAWARTSSCAYRRLALLGGFDDLVPLSLGEAPLTGKSQGSGSLEAQLSDCPAVRPRPQMHPGGAHLLAALQERHRLAGAFAAYPAPYCATGSLLGPRPKGALITSTTTRP